ncbi:MAG: ornithine--oxo-acid transaminase [Deltaproteobacteria bacterium CG_4_10_14_0_2_um_filter_43_8]|nr:MAG: ornithine--oxo-acid transaminase [Deltaproteobacteria bacterium CG11_big_fil_rev_8_21_14_0_20_42_23]PJA18263.1 MAG: ornithine--oxo-acid transaminase [Deltaproteobacteria bacterium CG_4_10_14_0_2_um_filter_43_8]PJC64909.1 MAG: ornithine--oxo-acid transaminase [Deltaproteobacteria bacterium CG_4_9_14_0_2_um_filter_42_21]
MARSAKEYIQEVDEVSAHNYHPIPVVVASAEGAWVTDVEGNRYLDMLSAYSAVNQGHRHPKIIQALKDQADRLTLTSRAFHNDRMGPFMRKLTKLTGFDKALLMNTGAEGVETAIKAARSWGYRKKGITENKAKIIVCSENFHGRTTTIISFSTDPLCRENFGPFTPGFEVIPYNDAAALEKAIDENTCAFLVEPIQGEAGVIVPSEGYLKKCREICSKHNVLLICDEIQTGFGRTGKLFCYQYDGITPDIVIIGKALGGGVYPVSGILANDEVMESFRPGNHGSTFGGNPLAAEVARAAIDVIIDEKLAERSAELGQYFKQALASLDSKIIKDVRGKGLMIGVELTCKARPYCEALKGKGILAKETHENTIRFAPPLVISKEDLDNAISSIKEVLVG